MLCRLEIERNWIGEIIAKCKREIDHLNIVKELQFFQLLQINAGQGNKFIKKWISILF